MRALIVGDVVGGVRTFIAELSRGLSELGAEVHLALIGPGPPGDFTAASCEVRDLRLEWMPDAWTDIEATSRWVEELRARHCPDLVHMNTFAPVRDPAVPVLLTVHSCVLTWWRAVHGADAPPEWSRYAQLARTALDRASTLTAPTRALLDELDAVYGALPPARVIPNGRALVPPPEPRDDKLVVSAGRLWDGAKNAAATARAAPSIDGRVVLIGPGPAPTADIGTTGALPPDEVARWLSRASVFVEPARYEPFGLAALEAALCGCALVLGDIPSLREVWDDAASFVAPDDADALARTVNTLLADPPARRRAANLARARAARYTRAATARAYLDVYRELSRIPLAA